MKKLFFAFAAVALMGSATSCKKCGYCQYVTGDRSGATCQNSGLFAAVDDSYKQAEADCKATIGASWVVQK